MLQGISVLQSVSAICRAPTLEQSVLVKSTFSTKLRIAQGGGATNTVRVFRSVRARDHSPPVSLQAIDKTDADTDVAVTCMLTRCTACAAVHAMHPRLSIHARL